MVSGPAKVGEDTEACDLSDASEAGKRAVLRRQEGEEAARERAKSE